MGDPADFRFKLDRLLTYDEESIIAEMRRVASLIETPVITRAAFGRLARVSTDTCIRRFGGWREALDAAGLGDRYGVKMISAKMRDQRARSLTAEEVVTELRRIAALLGGDTLRRADVLKHSNLMGERVVLNRFGTWRAALDVAGLRTTPKGRRWHDDDYFENLLLVWSYYGRPPTFAEMDREPSRITGNGYAKKFGSWGKAKAAFVERVNSDVAEPVNREPDRAAVPVPLRATLRAEDDRAIRIGLRYQVLRRDRFRCATCGRSPATDVGCVLHVDHVIPFSRGGKTVTENLRSLCDLCNIGRGNRYTD